MAAAPIQFNPQQLPPQEAHDQTVGAAGGAGGVFGAMLGRRVGSNLGGNLGDAAAYGQHRLALTNAMGENARRSALADIVGGLHANHAASPPTPHGAPDAAAKGMQALRALLGGTVDTSQINLGAITKARWPGRVGRPLGGLAGLAGGALGGAALGRYLGGETVPAPIKAGEDQSPLCRAFFARCEAAGLTAAQTKAAVDKAAAQFPEAREELETGFEKVAGPWQQLGQMGQHAAGYLGSFARPAVSGARAAAKAPGALGTAGNMGVGAFVGNITGADLAGGENWYDPRRLMGSAAGAALGTRRFGNSTAGQTLRRPFYNAGAGAIAGSGADMAAGMAGYDTGGRLGQMGAWGGLGLGLANNRFQNQRDALVRGIRTDVRQAGGFMPPNMRSSAVRADVADAIAPARGQMAAMNNSWVNKGQQGLDQFFSGTLDPLKWVGRQTYGRLTGTAPAKLQAGQSAPGLMRTARNLGAATTAVPLAGVGYSLGTGALEGAVNRKISEGLQVGGDYGEGRLEQFLAEKGLLDPQTGQVRGLGNNITSAINGGADGLMRMLGLGGGGGAGPRPGAGLYSLPPEVQQRLMEQQTAQAGPRGMGGPGRAGAGGGPGGQFGYRDELAAQRAGV